MAVDRSETTSTDKQKDENLPTLHKIKRGATNRTKPTPCTTFNFAPTHPSPTHHLKVNIFLTKNFGKPK